MKVLCGCVIRSHGSVVERFLRSLERLRHSSFDLEFAFVEDVPNADFTCNKLPSFVDAHSVHVTANNIDPRDYSTKDYTIHEYNRWCTIESQRIAGFKNRFLQQAHNKHVDYAFILDDNVLLHPLVLEQLIRDEKDIVNCTSFSDDEQIKISRINRIGYINEAVLISSHAIRSGVSFDEINELNEKYNAFAVRALARNLRLYADTTHPVFIGTRSNLHDADTYLDLTELAEQRLTLSMVVHNEANRFLDHVLTNASTYITDAVIIDDASTDNTLDVIAKTLKNVPYKIVHNKTSKFSNEVELRKQQWRETVATNPDWILSLDADEVFEDGFGYVVRDLLQATDVDAHSFRLFDMWNKTHYRSDAIWNGHTTYRPFLIRYRSGLTYEWHETPQHCGRQPINIEDFKTQKSDLRLKHLGWSREDDRKSKYARYMKLDPKGEYGSLAQYESVFDPAPHLELF